MPKARQFRELNLLHLLSTFILPQSTNPFCPLSSSVLFYTIPTFLVTFSYSFAAGDVVLILPSNSEAHTQQFCQVLRLDPNQFFTLKPREPGEYGRCTSSELQGTT